MVGIATPTRAPTPAAQHADAPADAARPCVLLVAPEPFYEDRGTPIALRHVLRSYVAAGYAVDVLTYPMGASPPLPHVRYLRVANPLRFERVPIGFSLRKLVLDVLLELRLRRVLADRGYRMVHAVEESAFAAVVLARPHDTPVLYDMQSNLAHQLEAHRVLGWRPLHRLWRGCQRWLIRRAAAVACSMGLADDVREAAPHKPVFEWHYPGQVAPGDHDAPAQHAPAPDNPNDDSALAMKLDALREALRLPPDRRGLLYAGNFEPYQGIDLLIEAMGAIARRNPDVVLLMVGAQPGEMQAVRSRLMGPMDADRFRLLPRVGRGEMTQYLQLADVLVSPRVFGDNLPLKIVDYLASGRPIVATDIKAHRRVLSDDTAVLVEPTADALAAGITRLLQDPALQQTLTTRATAYFHQHPSEARFDRQVAGLLGEVESRALVAAAPDAPDCATTPPTVSVVIPVRNGAALLPTLIAGIHAQPDAERVIEVIVVDDGSTDGTAAVARVAGARVLAPTERSGNPAHARNVGARAARGDLLVFLDADCVPRKGWLAALLATRARGWRCVGGALAMPTGLGLMSRLDYYCGWYHVHERQTARPVSHHPPCNLAVDRTLFLDTAGFTEQQPIA